MERYKNKIIPERLEYSPKSFTVVGRDEEGRRASLLIEYGETIAINGRVVDAICVSADKRGFTMGLRLITVHWGEEVEIECHNPMVVAIEKEAGKLIEENDYWELKERMIECWVWEKLHYMIDTERFRDEALRKVMEKNKERLKELGFDDYDIWAVSEIIAYSKMDDENYLRKFRVEGDVLVSPDHCTIRIRDEENAKELIELLKTMHKEYVKILNENPEFQHACKLKEETKERAEEAEQRLRNFLQNKFGSSVFYQ